MSTLYQLQTFGGGRWTIVHEGPDRDALAAAGEAIIQGQKADGVRVMQAEHDEEYAFSWSRLVAAGYRPGLREMPEPWTPVVRPGAAPAPCATHADLASDEARRFLQPFFQAFLEESRLTLLEILHDETAAGIASSAGTLMQTVLQRVAVIQAQGTGKPAPERLKELQALVTARLQKLKADAQAGPPVALRPGKLEEGLLEVERRHGAEAEHHQFRALAAYLGGGKAPADKLEILFQLYEPNLDPRHARLFDRLGGELLSLNATLQGVLAPKGRRRVDRMISMVDLLEGRFDRPVEELPIGLRALSKLMVERGMPRCREAVRERLFREIAAKAPFTNESALSEEMRAIFQFFVHVQAVRPKMAAEMDFIEAIRERVDRMLQPSQIEEYLQGVKPLRDKLDRLLILAENSPVDLGKQRVAEPIRRNMGTDDMMREFVAPLKDRTGAIPTLAQLAQRFLAAKFDEKTEAEFVGVFDAMIYDILREDVLKTRGTPLERMQRIVRLCTQPPLPPGKARRFATEAIKASLGSPDFAKAYAERFPDEAQRRESLARLRDVLRNAGLLGG